MQALRAQSNATARQGADFRAALCAVKSCIFEARPLCASGTGTAHRREIEAGGFEQMPDTILRVSMAAYPWFLPDEAAARAAVGKPLTVDGIVLKITEAKRLPLASEIVLTLGKA